MDDIPLEVARCICDEVEEIHIPTLRLVSKFWNNVASPYLFNELKLVFTQASFNRLLLISKHPLLSKFVTSLVYEPNIYQGVTRNHWECFVRARKQLQNTPTCLDDIRPALGSNLTDRDERAYRRTLDKAKYKRNNDKLDRAWDENRKFFQEQEDMRERDYGAAELTQAISSFPNLRVVSMNHAFGLWYGDRENPFPEAAVDADIDGRFTGVCGVPQTKSLLFALILSKAQLQSLRLGKVGWKFLLSEPALLEDMKKVLKPLQKFEIFFVFGDNMTFELDHTRTKFRECRKFMGSYVLHDLLAATSQVEDLRVAFDPTFDTNLQCPADLENIFRSKKWPFLRSLSLECAETSDENWLAFLERHAPTLKNIDLRMIALSCGFWPNVLERMQSILTLRSVKMRAQITGRHPPQCWTLGPPDCLRGSGTRKAIEDFLISGGDCPLCDKTAHPMLKFE